MWLANWVDLITSIVRILSFSFYKPIWNTNFRIWCIKQHYKSKDMRLKNKKFTIKFGDTYRDIILFVAAAFYLLSTDSYNDFILLMFIASCQRTNEIM